MGVFFVAPKVGLQFKLRNTPGRFMTKAGYGLMAGKIEDINRWKRRKIDTSNNKMKLTMSANRRLEF
jgi:hypothetical protein